LSGRRMKFKGLSGRALRRIAKTVIGQEDTIRVFRGVGHKGAEEMRPSEGLLGLGIYFYKHPYDARSYASPGGGILYGRVSIDRANVYGDVVVVGDPQDVEIEGLIPSEFTNSLQDINDYLGEDFTRNKYLA